MSFMPIRTGSPTADPIRATRGFHWWYPAIIDRMISHPEWTKQQIAADLNISYSSVAMITTCDLFRAHFEKRRTEFSQAHDAAIRQRLIKAATVSLDKLIETVEAKPAGSIPIPQLVEMSTAVLDKLGYGPAPPPPQSVQVNVQANHLQVTAQELQEARAALRRSEASLLWNSPEGAARPTDRNGREATAPSINEAFLSDGREAAALQGYASVGDGHEVAARTINASVVGPSRESPELSSWPPPDGPEGAALPGERNSRDGEGGAINGTPGVSADKPALSERG